MSEAGCQSLPRFAVVILYLLNFQTFVSATAMNISEVNLHDLLFFHILLKYINWNILDKKKTMCGEHLRVQAGGTEELEKYMW